jgi:hypothetical protein
MDESFHELEAELKSLRPRRPAPALLERIEKEMATDGLPVTSPRYTSATNLNSWKWLGWRPAGIAAALAVIVAVSWINRKQEMPPAVAPAGVAATNPPIRPATQRDLPGSKSAQEIAATNVLYDLKDEGTVLVNGDTPARRVRYRYVDTYTWKNPRTNASLKWSVPRDEIRVLPAVLN